MKPDYDRAATLAAETLIKHQISATPVSPLPILKKTPGVLVVSYEDLSTTAGMDRQCVIDLFGEKNLDAFTSVNMVDGKAQYLVTYNQRLPYFLLQRALARELGHIVLGHDGSRPEDVRQEEAKMFAHHLMVPRPLIHMIQASNMRLTVDMIGNITGCYDYCLSCIRSMPGTHVPPELNHLISEQFLPYFIDLFEFYRYAAHKDGSALADLGSYMEGYEE